MRISLKKKTILISASIFFFFLLILVLQSGSRRHEIPISNNGVVRGDVINDDNDVMKYALYDKSPQMRRTQPGYMGSGVKVKKSEKKSEDEGYKKHSFNQLVSDKISLERSLPDYRNQVWVS